MEELKTGTRSPKVWVYRGAVVLFGLLNVILLVRFIGLSFYYHKHLQRYHNVSSLVKERDLLNVNLSKMAEELNRVLSLANQNKTCPAGWSRFGCSCYVLSNQSRPWHVGREDCRSRGADMVVIENAEEQLFVSTLTTKEAWIGLTDSEEEGTWKWVDGTPLTLTLWLKNQPDNGRGLPGMDNEDCAHISTDHSWNDLSCSVPLRWICEKRLSQRKK